MATALQLTAPDASAGDGSTTSGRLVATPKQQAFIQAVFSGAFRFLAFGGAAGGAKTFCMFLVVTILCKVFPGSRWAFVRKDLPTLRRTTLVSYREFRELFGGSFLGEVNQSTWIAPCANGSEIVFFTESLDVDPDLDRWKGLAVNGFVFEEANELARKSFDKGIERAGRWRISPSVHNPKPSQPPPYIFLTFNPASNWVRSDFYDPWKAGTLAAPFFFLPSTQDDNPYLSAQYRESTKHMDPLEYQRFILGDWDAVSGKFFDQVSAKPVAEGGHLVPVLGADDCKPWWTYWGGYDWGYRHNAVFSAIAKPSEGPAIVLDTVWMHRLSDDEQADRVVTQLDGSLGPVARRMATATVYAGSDAFAQRRAHEAAARTVADVFLAYDIILDRAHTSRVPGWRELRNQVQVRRADGATQPPSLVFADTPGNRRLIAALRDMVPDPKATEDVLKVDADDQGRGGDDGPDTLRYAVATPALAGTEPVKAPEREAGRDPVVFAPWTPQQTAEAREAGDQLGAGW